MNNLYKVLDSEGNLMGTFVSWKQAASYKDTYGNNNWRIVPPTFKN